MPLAGVQLTAFKLKADDKGRRQNEKICPLCGKCAGTEGGWVGPATTNNLFCHIYSSLEKNVATES